MSIFHHCPRCRGLLKNGRPQVCAVCSFEWFEDQKPSITTVIENEQGEILLTRRKYEPHKGKWETPGGFVELSETAEAAARRELREELGVKLGALRYITSLSTPYLYKGVRNRLLEIVFASRIVAGKIRPADDVAEARWFAPKKIPYKQLAFLSHGKLLRAYLRSR